jgi:hypothetical protein
MKITLAFTLLFGFLATALAQQFDNRYIVMLQRVSSIVPNPLLPS